MSISLTPEQIDRIIEMAWEDRTPFEAITFQFGITEMETKALMRKELKRSSYELWRKRVTNRKTKHQKLRNFEEGRFKCTRQRQISNNKIAKR
ncbi:TIGR03643 family protein [Flavobacterium sp. TP390]|uniref:TIGR03643 family protein n=1 Tax=Flavobacterium profundi TaxID=1774945 RepID=A0A6I4IT71_9FLAO|nr:TIGR03643 family protein [Flavobacterium profundi]MVO10018.1 TIGR03643 family protein [Flavobacterium profundi]